MAMSTDNITYQLFSTLDYLIVFFFIMERLHFREGHYTEFCLYIKKNSETLFENELASFYKLSTSLMSH